MIIPSQIILSKLFKLNKTQNYEQQIFPLIEAYCESNDSKKLENYIVSNSNLPGRRANLELAFAFADAIQDYSYVQTEKLWRLCSEFIKISSEDAPTNDPKEFLPFCGAQAIGVIGSVSATYFFVSLSNLKFLANDSRWRIREAVCFGLQRLLAKEGIKAAKELEGWINDGTFLELRAIAAALAEPTLLRDERFANASISLHKQIFERIQSSGINRKLKDFRTLRKTLGFTLSVVTCGNSEQGFEFMRHLIQTNDVDLVWIVKENLKKNRLIKNYPEEVESIKAMLP